MYNSVKASHKSNSHKIYSYWIKCTFYTFPNVNECLACVPYILDYPLAGHGVWLQPSFAHNAWCPSEKKRQVIKSNLKWWNTIKLNLKMLQLDFFFKESIVKPESKVEYRKLATNIHIILNKYHRLNNKYGGQLYN